MALKPRVPSLLLNIQSQNEQIVFHNQIVKTNLCSELPQAWLAYVSLTIIGTSFLNK